MSYTPNLSAQTESLRKKLLAQMSLFTLEKQFCELQN